MSSEIKRLVGDIQPVPITPKQQIQLSRFLAAELKRRNIPLDPRFFGGRTVVAGVGRISPKMDKNGQLQPISPARLREIKRLRRLKEAELRGLI